MLAVVEDARAAARRIVEEVLADHAARTGAPSPAASDGLPAAASPPVRSSAPPEPPAARRGAASVGPSVAPPAAPASGQQVLPDRVVNRPDTPGWRAARRIVDEVLAAHASSGGDTLTAEVDQLVVIDEEARSPRMSDSATVVIDLSEPVAGVELADVFPDELFAEHGHAAADQVATAPPVVPPPAEPDVEPVPDEPDVEPDVEPEPEPVAVVTVGRSVPETASTPEPVPPDPVPPDPVPPDPVPPDPVPPDPVPPDPVLPEPGPLLTASPSSLPRAGGAAKVSDEAAATASRIVAEVLAEHAAREASAAAEVGMPESAAIAPSEADVVEGQPSTAPELAVERADEQETTAELPAAEGLPAPPGEPLPPTEEIPTATGTGSKQGADVPDPALGSTVPTIASVANGRGESPSLEMPNGLAGATVIDRAVLDAPPPDHDERKLSADEDEFPAPRRTGRWLVTTVLGAVSLAFLFPLAVRALRELISLS